MIKNQKYNTKRIGLKMIDIWKLIYITLLSSFTSKYDDNTKKKLYKREEQKKINIKFNITQILIILVVIIIFIVISYLIYISGSLESTGYYYRINGRTT